MSKSSIKHFRYKVNLFLEKTTASGWGYIVESNGCGMWFLKEDISHLCPEDKLLREMLRNIDLKILFKSLEIRKKLDERLKAL